VVWRHVRHEAVEREDGDEGSVAGNLRGRRKRGSCRGVERRKRRGGRKEVKEVNGGVEQVIKL
jgi:hypothetical protein